MIRYRFIFGKRVNAKEQSFLNQIEYFKNFFINTFNLNNFKKLKFSFGPALGFGYESECEYVDVIFPQRINVEKMRMLVEKNLAEGYWLCDVRTIPLYFPAVESVVDGVEWEIVLPESINMDFVEGILKCFIGEEKILKYLINKNSLIVVLSKKLGIKNFLKDAFGDTKPQRIIRKKLYWKDLEGNYRII